MTMGGGSKMKLQCSARIENEQERKAIMSWVRSVANAGYSEIEDKVSLTYTGDPTHDDGHYWGIVHVFEQYAEHEITSTEE